MKKTTQRIKGFLERHGVLAVDEPWVPPDHPYWFYWPWMPPAKGFKGRYLGGSNGRT